MNQSTQITAGNRATEALKIWCVLLVLSGCVLLFALKTSDCFVDDAYTGFQYIENLRAGHGFVFHPSDRPVEGVTNIGWLLIVAALTGPAPPPVVAKLLGLGLVIFVFILLVAAGRVFAVKDAEHNDSFTLAVVPAVLLAGSFDFIYFSTAGMETALLAALLSTCCCIALFRAASFWLPALSAAASLAHPEAAIVFPIYAMLHLYRACDRKRLIGCCLVWAGMLAAITAARWSYFGDLVPNTFHSKPSNLELAIQNAYAFLSGNNSNIPFPIVGWISLPLLALGYYRLRRASAAGADMLAAVAIAGLAFAVYSPPDWTATARFFAPYLPAALLLLWSGVIEFRDLPFPWRHRTKHAAMAAVVVLLALTATYDCRDKLAALDGYPGYVMASKDLVGPAVWMRDNLPADSVIATRRIGALAYFSRHPVYDYVYGLPDAETALLVARNGGRFHTPTAPVLARRWKSRRPDYLLEDEAVLNRIISQTGGTRENFHIHGDAFGVIRRFQIGRGVQWVLAARLEE